jgi:hypothetical protein
MSPNLRKSGLSAARQRLVELFQRTNFGRIENLTLKNGEPEFDPPPRVVAEIKLAAENGPRPERATNDFALKAQHVELFATFDRLGNEVIDIIEIKNGLPFKMEFAATVR